MKIRRIGLDDVHLLRLFIDGMGTSEISFRYFRNRSICVIANHIVTLVGLDTAGTPVAYGHLDREGGTVWLGLCVRQGHTGQGLGKLMAERLITEAKLAGVMTISLTVDDDNLGAIALYEGLGFKNFRQDGDVRYYRFETHDEAAS